MFGLKEGDGGGVGVLIGSKELSDVETFVMVPAVTGVTLDGLLILFAWAGTGATWEFVGWTWVDL